MYPSSAVLAILAIQAINKISNLRVIKTPHGFDSRRLHQLNRLVFNYLHLNMTNFNCNTIRLHSEVMRRLIVEKKLARSGAPRLPQKARVSCPK